MKVISNEEFGGERPLFESHDLRLENVIIRTGESAIKECSTLKPSIVLLRATIRFGTSMVSSLTAASSMWAGARHYGIPTT